MTAQEAITRAGELTTGTPVESEDAVRWLSEYDGKLAREFFKAASWEEYNPATPSTVNLIIPHPWDGLYVHLLETLTYYSTGEYQRSDNARAVEERLLAEFKAWVMRQYGRPTPCVLEDLTQITGG